MVEGKLKPELQPGSAARHEQAVRPMVRPMPMPMRAWLATTETRDSSLPGVSGENPQRTRCGHAAAARGKPD
jgi:hypothetical protein